MTHYSSQPGQPLCLREARPCVLPPVFPSCFRHSPMQGASRDPGVHHHSVDHRPPTRRHRDLRSALHYNLVPFSPALALTAAMLVETSWSQQGGLAFVPKAANGLLTLPILPGQLGNHPPRISPSVGTPLLCDGADLQTRIRRKFGTTRDALSSQRWCGHYRRKRAFPGDREISRFSRVE